MKFIKNIKENLLFYLLLVLLVFIPLYPKLPLINVTHTWVYVRVEDFLVLFTLIFWIFLLLKKKVTLKTPLTIPILAYWVLGAVATIHGVIIIFPTIAGVFPNVALFAYLRHIEYIGIFFVAYSAIKSRKFLLTSIWTIAITLLGVIVYGFGQKYLSFPAYLTMNEEYAKGVPIIVSSLSRISSTFAGHYDLAAYLVLIIPILASLFFGFKNIFLKIIMAIVSLLGIILLFMTVSRVSFFALFVALIAVIFFNKKKLVFIFTPILLVVGFLFLYSHSSLLNRFNSTVKEIDVLVDAKTGGAIGQVRIEPRGYLLNKHIIREKELISEYYATKPVVSPTPIPPDVPLAFALYRLPLEVPIVEAKMTSNGETLPQGSEYVNLTLAPVTKRFDSFFYEYPPSASSPSAQIQIVPGTFLVKKASAYDLSFTTRFQGEWPRTLEAFERNLFFGSGFGSVSLAVDNNYLRMLGETGMLGTVAFALMFVVLGAYIRKTLKDTDDRVVRSFVLGYAAGAIGLAINATLIDVFEASKVAFVLWMLTGIVVGALSLYQTKHFNVYHEIKNIASSTIAVITYMVLLILAIFSNTVTNYLIGDDFTWLRWAADCKHFMSTCSSVPMTLFTYFINSGGFFYRPGTKSYFLLMYHFFALNQVVYHFVSVSLHLIVVILLYMLARKITKNNLIAATASLIFLIASGYLEIVMWIASTGHLFNAVFILVGLLMFIKWYETKRVIYLIVSIMSSLLSLAFYELGIIVPVLCIAYLTTANQEINLKSVTTALKNKIILLLFIPDVIYLIVRFMAHTYWFHGDYSYNLIKLPFNFIGNLLGYLILAVIGPFGYPFYDKLRTVMKSNIPIAIIVTLILLVAVYFIGKKIIKNLTNEEKRVVLFAGLFVIITLIPFVGLGNITFRYSYLASFGVYIILMILAGKFYKHLTYYGKDIAYGVIGTLAAAFVLLHVIQAQQMIIEWRGGGDMVKKFLISIDSLYNESWSTQKADLYFVNVPIKDKSAWVFPVGLNDALWFVTKNDNINVIQVPTVNDVPSDVYYSTTKWAFEFQPDGSLVRLMPANKIVK